MDGITLEKIKNLLLTRRRQIRQTENELNLGPNLVTALEGEPQAELVDLAQAAEQLDRVASLAEQERRELIAIDRALTKIATHQFGICEECEEEIPIKRLLVVPEARLCARCQGFQERQQGRNRGIPFSAA